MRAELGVTVTILGAILIGFGVLSGVFWPHLGIAPRLFIAVSCGLLGGNLVATGVLMQRRTR